MTRAEQFVIEKRRAIFDGLNDVFTDVEWKIIERGMAYFGELYTASLQAKYEHSLECINDNCPQCCADRLILRNKKKSNLKGWQIRLNRADVCPCHGMTNCQLWEP